MDEKFVEIINEMAEVLNAAQLKRLQEVMLKHLVEREPRKRKISNRYKRRKRNSKSYNTKRNKRCIQ